jgi:hypothetical protein
MRTLRRRLAVVWIVLAVGTGALAISACGSASHLAGGIVAHHVIDHFVHTQKGLKRVDKLFCLYHGHRVLVDVHSHHYFIAGLQAIAAVHDCRAGFKH